MGGKVSLDGAEFSGAEMIYNYERVLRQVTYSNKKPAYYLNRQFRITCSELNGRFVSNEYVQTLTVIHPQLPQEQPAKGSSKVDIQLQAKDSHLKIGVHGVEQPLYNLASEVAGSSQNFFANGAKEQSNITAMIIIVCVGLLLTVIVIGVFRLRAAHNRTSKEELQQEVEMAWDDSALNITVNPIDEAENQNRQKVPMVAEVTMDDGFVDSSDEEDDMIDVGDLYHDEDEDEDEDEVEDSEDECNGISSRHGRRARLEWDNNI